MTRRDDGKDLLALWQEACGEGEDPFRRLAEVLLQRLLEAEMTALGWAEPNERSAHACSSVRLGSYRHCRRTRPARASLGASIRNDL